MNSDDGLSVSWKYIFTPCLGTERPTRSRLHHDVERLHSTVDNQFPNHPSLPQASTLSCLQPARPLHTVIRIPGLCHTVVTGIAYMPTSYQCRLVAPKFHDFKDSGRFGSLAAVSF